MSWFDWFRRKKEGPRQLVGKKVWVVQNTDTDTSIFGIMDSIGDGFVGIRAEEDTEPRTFINLLNVRKIEVFPEQDAKVFRSLSVVRPTPEKKPDDDKDK